MDLCKSASKAFELHGRRAPPVIGIVKQEESAEGDLGVVEFHYKYFSCAAALYLDEERELFKQLGERKINIPAASFLKPWKMWTDMQSLAARLKDKGVEGNMKGDGLVQGGIVVLGPAPECAVLYTYYEETGKQIPVLELDAAIAKAVGR